MHYCTWESGLDLEIHKASHFKGVHKGIGGQYMLFEYWFDIKGTKVKSKSIHWGNCFDGLNPISSPGENHGFHSLGTGYGIMIKLHLLGT